MTDNKAFSLRSQFLRTDYTDLETQYDNAYEWFESFGFNLAATRLHHYKNVIHELAKHQAAGTLNTAEFRSTFEQQVVSLSEASEIIRIFRGVENLYSSELKSKVETVLSGRNGRPDPKNFDPSRDIGFELLMASRLKYAGFSVDFDKHNSDLSIKLPEGTIYFECKRLKSSKKVRKRIIKGLKQLRGSYKSDHQPLKCRGLLALSITDLVNPAQGLMVGDTPEEVAAKVGSHLEAFITKNQDFWQKTQDRRSIGVFVELSAQSIVESENLFSTFHLVGMNNSCPTNSSDYRLFLDIATQLAGSQNKKPD